MPIDESLRAPGLTDPPPVLGSAEPPLVQAGPVEVQPFLVEAGSIEVRGTERGGIDSVVIGGQRVLAALRTDRGMGANVVLSPCSCLRELVGGGGSTLETVLIAPALPLAVVQWRPPHGAPALWSFEVGLTLLPGSHGVRHSAGTSGLRALGKNPPDLAVDLVFHPQPAELTVTEATDGGLAVHGRFAAAGPVTLLLSSGPVSGRPPAVTAAPHLRAHELRCARDASQQGPETLIAGTGVEEIDHGVAWASLRLGAALHRARATDNAEVLSTGGSDLFWSGLGALAVGDGDGCLRALSCMRPEGDTLWVDGRSVSEGALRALLAGGATLLTGDPSPALEVAEHLAVETLLRIRVSTTAHSWDVWQFALEWLVDALLGAAPKAEIERLREEAHRDTDRPGSVRLPMAGEPAQSDAGPASLLRLLLGTEALIPPAAQSVADELLGGALQGWTQLRRGTIDEGYRTWRGTLVSGLMGGPSGRGSWDPEGAGAPVAGQVLAGFARGLLGLAPDAPSGRIRIAPAFPSHLSAFVARRIRLGDTRIDLEYRKEHGRHRFELSPTEGRVPATVIFEPSIPAEGPGRAFIDGQPAELVQVREGNRLRVRAQLPLDGRRTVEVEEV